MTDSSTDEMEKKIFSAIETSDIALLRSVLDTHPSVNIVDENSMAPLQHAAYKGDKDMVQMLLDYGADPNLCKHQHNYTALHFAGLSGNSEVCLALLMAGASPEVTNAVNRTAAQMAAFVGHHKCVSVINNFIQKSEVDYYTVIQGTQTEPYLPLYLSGSFHKLLIQVNMHPVKIALNVYRFVGIAQHLSVVKKVLELMCEKEIKKDSGKNEATAFKFFYLAQIIEELINIEKKHNLGDDSKKPDILQIFCKSVLKPTKDGSLEVLDLFLKGCIKRFPYRECNLIHQMVSSLTNKDAPTAYSVINSAINGQRGFIDNVVTCHTCGEENPCKKCSQCKTAQYCDKNCQKLHWHWHKKMCSQMAEEFSQQCKKEEASVDTAELANEIQNLVVSK